MPEPGRSWVFERNTWAGHNIRIPSLSREIVAETYAVVGCSEFFECDSVGSVSPFGLRPGSGIGSGWRLRRRTRGPPDKSDQRGARYSLPDRVSEKPEFLKTMTCGL